MIENFFLDLGLSWTMSKSVPYVISALIGFIIAWLFRGKFKGKLALAWLLRVTLFVAPFLLYFLYAPIYEGDFSNNYTEVDRQEHIGELGIDRLIVLSIPGCPFCYSSIDKMKIFKGRNPEAEIVYLVCGTKDEEVVEWYKDKGGSDIKVQLADSSQALSQLAHGSFPTFVLAGSKQSKYKVWSNDNFGVFALDEVELSLN